MSNVPHRDSPTGPLPLGHGLVTTFIQRFQDRCHCQNGHDVAKNGHLGEILARADAGGEPSVSPWGLYKEVKRVVPFPKAEDVGTRIQRHREFLIRHESLWIKMFGVRIHVLVLRH